MIKKHHNLTIRDDYILMSLNVQSLFTKVPLNLVIEGLERRFTSLLNCKMPLHKIEKCTKFIFNSTFVFHGKYYYKQIDGTRMGSFIPSCFLDIVMDDFECVCKIGY